MIAHLPRCLALDPTGRYACNCGADAQNELARRLDALPVLTPAEEAEIIVSAPGQIGPGLTPIGGTATPLRAVARMLRRMRDRATHHDDARLILTTAYAAADLAATLIPEDAIRVLDEVEPPAEDDANEPTH